MWSFILLKAMKETILKKTPMKTVTVMIAPPITVTINIQSGTQKSWLQSALFCLTVVSVVMFIMVSVLCSSTDG